jgi:hypothetical protein
VHFGTVLGVIGGLLSYTGDFIVSGPNPLCLMAGSALHGLEREGRQPFSGLGGPAAMKSGDFRRRRR